MSLTTNPFDDDKLHEECGIFGVYGHIDLSSAYRPWASRAAASWAGSRRNRHYEDGQFFSHRAAGHVGDNFSKESVIAHCPAPPRSATTGIPRPATPLSGTSSPCSPISPQAALRSLITAI